MDVDPEFEAAAAILVADADVGEEGAEELDANFELAAAIVAQGPVARRLGFQHRGPASTAYARKCREAQRSEAKVAELEAKLEELNERTAGSDFGGMRSFVRFLAVFSALASFNL